MEKGGVRLGRGFDGEEGDQEFVGFEGAAAGEWARSNGLSQFVWSAQNDLGTAPKLAFDRILDFACQGGEVFLCCPENDIAALHVGARVLELERFVESTQG